MNAKLLKAKMVESDFTNDKLAKMLGLNINTVGRKMRTDGFTVREARAISKALHLTSVETCDIFFA